MEKKSIEILADVLATEETGKTISVLKRNYHNDSISPGKCIEAMKIFGKQCFDAAKLRHWATDADIYTNFDEYIKELEVRNEKVK